MFDGGNAVLCRTGKRLYWAGTVFGPLVITYKGVIQVLCTLGLPGRLLMGMKELFLLIVLDTQPIYNYRPFKKYAFYAFLPILNWNYKICLFSSL